DLVIRQRDARLAALERRAIALPAREEIGRERDVALRSEALREVDRVLHEAVTLVQDDEGAGARLAGRQIQLAVAAVAESEVHLRSRRKSACQRPSHVSHSLR